MDAHQEMIANLKGDLHPNVHQDVRGIKPKSKASRGVMLSDIAEAALKNIELYMTKTDGFGQEFELLTDFVIPQLKEIITRLKA